MSTIYNIEPPTKGKVTPPPPSRPHIHPIPRYWTSLTRIWSGLNDLHIRPVAQVILKTSLGELDIELWPKEAPMVRALGLQPPLDLFICFRRLIAPVPCKFCNPRRVHSRLTPARSPEAHMQSI